MPSAYQSLARQLLEFTAVLRSVAEASLCLFLGGGGGISMADEVFDGPSKMEFEFCVNLALGIAPNAPEAETPAESFS